MCNVIQNLKKRQIINQIPIESYFVLAVSSFACALQSQLFFSRHSHGGLKMCAYFCSLSRSLCHQFSRSRAVSLIVLFGLQAADSIEMTF